MSGVIAVVPESVAGIEEIRAQLKRIHSSPDFEATEREHRFLAYIVDEVLHGRGDRIKAYSIAVEVFGRDASFDAQHDPIVRIAAGHLRRALERYYLTGGKTDLVRITIPKGCYIPQFSTMPAADVSVPATEAAVADLPRVVPADSGTAPFWRGIIGGLGVATLVVFAVLALLPMMGQTLNPTSPDVPRIQVMRLEDLTGSSSSSMIANGLTQEIVAQLSKFRDIVVLQAAYAGATLDPPPRFILDGSVETSGDAFHLRIRLLNREDGSILWAHRFDGALKASELVDVQSRIAETVAISLAQTYGVIFQTDASQVRSRPPDDWAAYSCTLSYYAYRMSMDQSAQPKIRRCLESSVEKFPNYSTGWALLAQIQLEQVRFTLPYDPEKAAPAIEEALANARRATELDPLNTRALQAEMFGLFFTRQFEAGRKVGDRALELNPNDTELIGEYGYRLAVSGDWQRGCALLAKARDSNPGANGYYESGLALCSLFKHDSETAIMWVRKTTVPKNALYHLIAAAIFGDAGLIDEGRAEIDWLCANRPVLVQNVEDELNARLGQKKDVDFVMAALRKAGLSAPSGSDRCAGVEPSPDPISTDVISASE